METRLRCQDSSGLTSSRPRSSVTPISRFSSRTGTPPTPLVLMTANASETSRVAKACPPIHTRLPLALA